MHMIEHMIILEESQHVVTWCQEDGSAFSTEKLSLDGNISENWRRWKQHCDIFSLASGLSGKVAKVQAATFLHIAGPEALEVYNTFTWDDNHDKSKVNKIIEKFDQYCNPRKNIMWESHNTDTRESIISLVTNLTRETSNQEKLLINM